MWARIFIHDPRFLWPWKSSGLGIIPFNEDERDVFAEEYSRNENGVLSSLSSCFRPGERSRTKRSENSVGGVWSLLLNFNTTGRGRGWLWNFHQRYSLISRINISPATSDNSLISLQEGRRETGSWDTELFAIQRTVDETMSEGERERERGQIFRGNRDLV